ncbi:putative oligopeptide transporter [Golovinomyces cichoracearum]|uniref:Putative oligopeptide transporter n=1 Tax=Golovinomyces cichoracearum TaxID=62708 RepID=A0A420IVR6_9PEZI|nr:putative oligopeptide transporter [Golovinomyces cichoracearum]
MASNLHTADYQSIPSFQKIISQSEDTPEDTDVLNSQPDFIVSHAQEQQNFTLRGVLVGLVVGTIVCFSNMYFGLQSGWISPMSMPSALMGFVFFKSISRHLDLPFTPVENVLIQSVAGGMGTMPLGCALVGVMPALNNMLTSEENGPVNLSLWKLILWSLGLCFFGVIFAVPLRKQVIIREKLKFPSGTATAIMIRMLHEKKKVADIPTGQDIVAQHSLEYNRRNTAENYSNEDSKGKWRAESMVLGVAFALSGTYTVATYFFPVLRDLPIFGTTLASTWLWTLNPSLAYIGQGIIMGPATTSHMLLGAVVGWGILSPMAKYHGWAPGSVGDWNSGSKGWIVWISLAIMLTDSVISLGYVGSSTVAKIYKFELANIQEKMSQSRWKGVLCINICSRDTKKYTHVPEDENPYDSEQYIQGESENTELDAPPENCVKNRTVSISGVLSIIFCVISIRVAFGSHVPIYATILAIFVALILSIMGVRALGETDLNPVSGISKIAQLLFALIIPRSNKNSVIINLVAGAISEAGALQAGDLLQDLKTGHLLGAAPDAQFWGQIIGSAFGAVTSALIYKLYTNIYPIPGEFFQVPSAHVWIFTARLVTGQGLPPMAWLWSIGAIILFTGITILRIIGTGRKWHPFIPGGIAVAVGIYNVPSFTLARAIGGFLGWYLKKYKYKNDSTVIILASGLILGEGIVSILNLILASVKVPHL